MSDCGAQANATSGKSRLDVDAKRVDIILALHGNFRTHVQFWHDQVYKAATWSILPAYALVAFWIDQQKPGNDPTRLEAITWAVILLIGFIWLASWRYLHFCHNAYVGNWFQIANCQEALRLFDEDKYLGDRPFFNRGDSNQARGMRGDDIILLMFVHALAFALAIAIILFLHYSK